MTRYKKIIVIMIATYIFLLCIINNSCAFSTSNPNINPLIINGKINTDIKSFIDFYAGGYLVLPFCDINIPTLNKDLKFGIRRTYNSRSQGLGLVGY